LALVTGAIRNRGLIAIQASIGAVLGALTPHWRLHHQRRSAAASAVRITSAHARLNRAELRHDRAVRDLMPLLFQTRRVRATSGKSRGKEYFVASGVLRSDRGRC